MEEDINIDAASTEQNITASFLYLNLGDRCQTQEQCLFWQWTEMAFINKYTQEGETFS